MSGLQLGTCKTNLKSVASTVLEQLAFNTPKSRDHVTQVTFPFRKFLRGHVSAVHGNMLAKFGVHNIRHFNNVVH